MTTTDFDEAAARFWGDDGGAHDEPDPGGENPTQARLAALRSALVDTDGLDGLPDPVPLVEGILFRDSLAWIYGKPGSGKSFVGIDWAGCVANGLPWAGVHEVSKGSVLYLVAEGTSGIRRRVRAWERHTGIRMHDVTFLPIAVQLLHGTDLRALELLVQETRPALIVIDTQARCTVGANENDNGEMGNVVNAADELRKASGSCVLLIHHSGRNGENMRGASAFDGAATSIIKVTKNDEYVEVHCDKQKDVEDFDTVFLKMQPVLESCVLINRTSSPAEENQLSRTEQRVLDVMHEVFPNESVSRARLVEVSEMASSTVYRSVAKLERLGFLVKTGSESRPCWRLSSATASAQDGDAA
ncbi:MULTISPECIES: helicase RepA family protein [unclassified Streptomyces]|uniref:helicase RepA family protein n=1 Tax=unclassified Streptomyces TaxID=2593676 RepID=UPI0038033475